MTRAERGWQSYVVFAETGGGKAVMDAGNAAYKLLPHLGHAQAVGPILVGMEQPVQIVASGALVTDVVNMTAMAVQAAQRAEGK